MYEEGKYVKKNLIVAEEYIISAAYRGNDDALEWCEDHFIKELSWNKIISQGQSSINSIFDEKISKILRKININTLEELRLCGVKNIISKELLPEEKIVYDMEYIQNRSLGMDLQCILKTIQVIFTHKGAR